MIPQFEYSNSCNMELFPSVIIQIPTDTIIDQMNIHTASFDFPSVIRIISRFLVPLVVCVTLNNFQADCSASAVAVRPQFRVMLPIACKSLVLSVNAVKLKSSSTKEAYIVTPIWTWLGPISTALAKSSMNVFILGKSVSFTDEELSMRKTTSALNEGDEHSEKATFIAKPDEAYTTQFTCFKNASHLSLLTSGIFRGN